MPNQYEIACWVAGDLFIATSCYMKRCNRDFYSAFTAFRMLGLYAQGIFDRSDGVKLRA